MSESPGTRIEDVLNPQEVAVVKAVQDLYGAEAKLAAGELADVLGSSEEQREQLIGGVTLRLEGLNFEDRRRVAQGFRGVAALLGGRAVAGGEVQLEEPGLVLARLLQDSNQSEVSTGQTNGLAPDEDIDKKPNHVNPLSGVQRRWLSRFLPEEAVERIEALPVYQRLDFAGKLGVLYQGLSITRLNLEAKKLRTEQMIALMGGKSYQEISERSGASSASVQQGLQQMPKSIGDRVETDELVRLIPRPKPIDQEADQPEDSPQRSRTQRNWYAKIFEDEEDVEVTELLTPQQQAQLAESLARRLRAYIIRKEGPVKTERRVLEMTLLITGHPIEAIAETISLPAGNIRNDLNKSASSLARHTSQQDIKRILHDALTVAQEQ
jgi:hypothetical protein